MESSAGPIGRQGRLEAHVLFGGDFPQALENRRRKCDRFIFGF